MHRLEITGETPDALYMNVISTLSLFLRGPQPVADEPAPPPVHQPDPAAIDETPPTKKRGRPAKVEAKVETLDEPLPDLTGEPAKPLTLDGDIRPMLRAIQKEHSARGHDMSACVAWIQRLYSPFGIAKADQLKPEHFAEFMDAAQAYLDGTAEG